MRPYKELLTFSSLGHTLKIYDINMNLNPDPNPDMNPNMNMNSDETFMTAKEKDCLSEHIGKASVDDEMNSQDK